jgi:hypothetical protein
MKIYLDDFFYLLHPYPKTTTHFQNINKIPNDCDIIAVSFYNNHWHEHLQTIQELSTRTKKLLVNLSEPISDNMSFTDFVDSINYDNVYLFSDVVFNYEPNTNIENIVSWFIGTDNFYATQPWAKQRISQLDAVLQRHRLLSPSQLAFGNSTKNMCLVLPRSMMFDCLLGVRRPHRDIIQTCYTNSQYRDKILFSYYKSNDNIAQGIWDQDVDQFEGTSASRYALLPLNIYNQTYYSIVAETTTENSFNQYTEKVAKPIIAGRPFVAFAGQHYLSNLRHLGFKTFASVIDESYDSIARMHQRMRAAWCQVEWLCEQDPEHVYRELHEVLQHNRQHFLTTDWHKAIQKHF